MAFCLIIARREPLRPDLLLKNPQRLLERLQGLCAILQRKQRAVADRVVLDEQLGFGQLS